MIEHIKEDCKLFEFYSAVREIRESLIFYQDEIEKLKISVLSYIDCSSQEEYRKNSAALFEKLVMLGEDLLNSKTLESYSKLYIRYHIGDLSILYEERDKNLLYIASKIMDDTVSLPESEIGSTTTERELKTMLKERDFQLAQCKKNIDELIKLVKKQKKQILKLKEQSQKVTIINIQDQVQENHTKLAMTQKIYNQIYETNEKFDENFEYSIFMNENDDLEILEYTSEIKFPLIKTLSI